MYYQTGNMRNVDNDSPARKSQLRDQQDDFNYDQRSKYQKSQKSQIQYQKSRVIYQEQKSQRFSKTNQCKDINRVFPVKVRYQDRQQYQVNFRLQLISNTQKNNKSLNVNLTDDNDSLFLWSFFIRQSQYLLLKEQQQMRVDFQVFPQALLQFINGVDQSNNNREQQNSVVNYASFEVKKGSEQAQLKFSALGKYKQTLQFLLKFKKANDQQLKIYLSQKFDKEKKQNFKLSEQLSIANNELNKRMQDLQRLNIEYQQLERGKNTQISDLQRKEKEKIRQITLRVQQQYLQKQKDQSERNSRKINDLSTKLQQFQRKYEQVFNNYQKANERIINLQSSQSSLKSRNSMLDQQCESFDRQNKDLKAKQLKLNEQYHLLKNQNTKLKCNVQSLQDKLKQKDQRLSQNSQIKSTNVNQITTLEQNLRQQKKKVEKLQQKNQALEMEFSKLKKKNDDLQSKYQKKKDRFADSKQIITMQQQKIAQKQKQIGKLLDQIKQLQNSKDQSERQIKGRDLKIDELKSNISNLNQHIEDQKRIISELNKKLNQKTIGGIGSIGGLKSYTPTGPLPMYTTLASTSTVGRDFSSTVSSNSQSRMRYSPSPLSTSPLNQKSQKIVPPFKKFRQGIQNDRDLQNNSYHSQSHSRSPIANRLSQQIDPEDGDKTKQKISSPATNSIGPIKFKK